MSLLLNMLSRWVRSFLPRSNRLLISWLQSPSAVILEPPKIKSDTVSTVSPYICHEVMGPDAMIFVFWMLSFKPTFSLSSFTFISCSLKEKKFTSWRIVSFSTCMNRITPPPPLSSVQCLSKCPPPLPLLYFLRDAEACTGMSILHQTPRNPCSSIHFHLSQVT